MVVTVKERLTHLHILHIMQNMHEFQIIQSYFTSPTSRADLGVGDDCALFRMVAGHQCAVTSDMLVSGRHFFHDVDARALGHKALAVNLSDLAAMGAEPLGFTLSLALPAVNEAWLADFSGGMLALARDFNCDLIGGDTTKSAASMVDNGLVINITAFGQVPAGAAIRRDGARAGDELWVSGALGDAACALALLQRERAGEVLSGLEFETLVALRPRLEHPTPRIALGLALRGVASSMLDVSDGLAGDVRHILRASHVDAEIDCDALPLSSPLKRLYLEQQCPSEHAWRDALTGGDDYELCFTAPVSQREAIQTLAVKWDVPLTRIGRILERAGEHVNDESSVTWRSEHSPEGLAHMSGWRGYNHFS